MSSIGLRGFGCWDCELRLEDLGTMDKHLGFGVLGFSAMEKHRASGLNPQP